jgi:hypothetical protein
MRRVDRAMLVVSATSMGADQYLVKASDARKTSLAADDMDFVYRPELDRKSRALCAGGYSVMAEGNSRTQYDLDYFTAYMMTPATQLSPVQRMILTMPAPAPEIRWQVRCDGARGWIGPGRMSVEAPTGRIMEFPFIREHLGEIRSLPSPTHKKLTLLVPNGEVIARHRNTALDVPDEVRALRNHRETVAAVAEGIKKRGLFRNVEVNEYGAARPEPVPGEVTLAVEPAGVVTLTRPDRTTLSIPVNGAAYEKYTGRALTSMSSMRMVSTAVVALLDAELAAKK